jgi:hypothetical protein
VWWPVPGPCEWPWCEKLLDGGLGVVDAGRWKFIDGTVKIRSAEAPSAGHEASADDSRAGRDTSNSRPQAVQRNG